MKYRILFLRLKKTFLGSKYQALSMMQRVSLLLRQQARTLKPLSLLPHLKQRKPTSNHGWIGLWVVTNLDPKQGNLNRHGQIGLWVVAK